MKEELNSEVCMLNADVILEQIKVHCRHFLRSFFSFSLTTLCSIVKWYPLSFSRQVFPLFLEGHVNYWKKSSSERYNVLNKTERKTD